MKQLKVALLCGGKSAEHEVSIRSARSILAGMEGRYEVLLVGIDKRGEWHELSDLEEEVVSEEAPRFSLDRLKNEIDVVFPALHGPFGEDGRVQGLLEMVGIPYVGGSVLGSAVCMDKDVSKRLLRDAGVAQTEFIVKRRGEAIDLGAVIERLGLPLFVKPANLGSSVGISKVKKEGELPEALEKAFEHDEKVVIEAFAKGREIECAVLGNEDPAASLPAELIPTHEFYSYEAKYLDPNGARYVIPAALDFDTIGEIQRRAIEAFRCLCCKGLARVDFFLLPNGELLLNEVNTLPGFTAISLYPKMWQTSGLSFESLVDRLIELALSPLAVGDAGAHRLQ